MSANVNHLFSEYIARTAGSLDTSVMERIATIPGYEAALEELAAMPIVDEAVAERIEAMEFDAFYTRLCHDDEYVVVIRNEILAQRAACYWVRCGAWIEYETWCCEYAEAHYAAEDAARDPLLDVQACIAAEQAEATYWLAAEQDATDDEYEDDADAYEAAAEAHDDWLANPW